MRVVHYLNQFFGGVGGEDHAGGDEFVDLGVRETGVGEHVTIQDMDMLAVAASNSSAIA